NRQLKTRPREPLALTNKKPDASKVLSDVAKSYIRQSRNAEAAATLERALNLDSTDPDTLMELGGLCGKCGLSAEAEHCYLGAADIFAAADNPAKIATSYEAATPVSPYTSA